MKILHRKTESSGVESINYDCYGHNGYRIWKEGEPKESTGAYAQPFNSAREAAVAFFWNEERKPGEQVVYNVLGENRHEPDQILVRAYLTCDVSYPNETKSTELPF